MRNDISVMVACGIYSTQVKFTIGAAADWYTPRMRLRSHSCRLETLLFPDWAHKALLPSAHMFLRPVDNAAGGTPVICHAVIRALGIGRIVNNPCRHWNFTFLDAQPMHLIFKAIRITVRLFDIPFPALQLQKKQDPFSLVSSVSAIMHHQLLRHKSSAVLPFSGRMNTLAVEGRAPSGMYTRYGRVFPPTGSFSASCAACVRTRSLVVNWPAQTPVRHTDVNRQKG